MTYLPNFKVGRTRSKSHMSYVGSLPCCACGREGQTQVHHSLISPEPKARGQKSSDVYVTPVCFNCHNAIHARGDEAAWWVARHLDPIAIAADLWGNSLAAGRA